MNLLPPKDISVGAFATVDVNKENYRHVAFGISVAANGEETEAVTLKEAKDKSGTSAATLVNTTLASGTFNIAASTDNQMYVVPVDASQLNRSSRMTHVGILTAAGAAPDLVGITAILSDPRYMQDVPPTALD